MACPCSTRGGKHVGAFVAREKPHTGSMSSRPSIRLSVLDLSPIAEGGSAGESLRNSADLAQHAERLGFHRYWLAEHHGMPGIASAATAVVIGHVAAATKTIRVGAGGIMLPRSEEHTSEL